MGTFLSFHSNICTRKCSKWVSGKKSAFGDRPAVKRSDTVLLWDRLPSVLIPLQSEEDMNKYQEEVRVEFSNWNLPLTISSFYDCGLRMVVTSNLKKSGNNWIWIPFEIKNLRLHYLLSLFILLDFRLHQLQLTVNTQIILELPLSNVGSEITSIMLVSIPAGNYWSCSVHRITIQGSL